MKETIVDFMNHRKKKFDVDSSIVYDDFYQHYEISVSYTHNGRQWYPASFTLEEAERLYLELGVRIAELKKVVEEKKESEQK